MQYWVIKANPDRYSYDENLGVGEIEDWHSKFPPSELKAGDRLFLWESSPHRRVVGFAEATKPVYRTDKKGLRVFQVRYLTTRLEWMPSISLLKVNPHIKGSMFLRPGVMRTVYPLTSSEAAELYRLTITRNPNEDIWRDVSKNPPLLDAEASAMEGSPRLVTHLKRERSPQLARKKKDDFKIKHGRLFCEACSSNLAVYGKLADNIFEVHHRLPLSDSNKPVRTYLKDLAVICPTCHRAIHRNDPMLSVTAFAKKLVR